MATTTASRPIIVTIAALGLMSALMAPAVVSGATNSANTTVSASIGSAISITTNSTIAINLTPTAGGVVSSVSDTVTVNTNNATGYALTLADGDANTNLVNGGNTIAAHTGSFASPTTLTNGSWGYRIVGSGGFGGAAYAAESNNTASTSTWAGVPSNASPVSIKSTSAVANNDVTTVWYGVKASAAQPNGAYTNQVTYSATTNP